jgi:hypothetical protein
MKRLTTIIQKPGGYVKIKKQEFLSNQSAQGGIVSFFIGAMIACIIALQVTWPVIDQAINTGNATANLSSSAVTLVNLVPLFLVLSLVMIFIRPLL